MFEDGTPGELFIAMAKEGSTISGLMDSFATAVSFGLQYGVPLKFYVDKFSHVRFEPSGFTGNPRITYAKSIMDYIFRWLALKFIGPDTVENQAGGEFVLRPTEPERQQQLPFGRAANMQDAPSCAECGGIMTRNGSCYKCENCGGTSGCSGAGGQVRMAGATYAISLGGVHNDGSSDDGADGIYRHAGRGGDLPGAF
jgi:ribonucleoside-diphosphate reductase alpha chain